MTLSLCANNHDTADEMAPGLARNVVESWSVASSDWGLQGWCAVPRFADSMPYCGRDNLEITKRMIGVGVSELLHYDYRCESGTEVVERIFAAMIA